MGLNLSFRVVSAGWLKALLIIVVVVVGILTPLVYFLWWAHGGGYEYEQRKKLESLVKREPTEDAQIAIEKKDFRLYTTGNFFDPQVPGFSGVDDDYKKSFGYRHLYIYTDKPLTREQRECNLAVLEYMATYNMSIFSCVYELYPNWREENKP